MGIFRSKFLPECWSIPTEDEAQKYPNCSHEWDCSCTWLEGRKLNGFQEVEVLINGEWVSSSKLKIHKKKFINSPIGIIPANSYQVIGIVKKVLNGWLCLKSNGLNREK